MRRRWIEFLAVGRGVRGAGGSGCGGDDEEPAQSAGGGRRKPRSRSR